MKKLIALLQIIAALVLFLIALATVVNLAFISTRPETISVVNALIGQGVITICLIALGRILLRRGLAGVRAANQAPANVDDSA